MVRVRMPASSRLILAYCSGYDELRSEMVRFSNTDDAKCSNQNTPALDFAWTRLGLAVVEITTTHAQHETVFCMGICMGEMFCGAQLALPASPAVPSYKCLLCFCMMIIMDVNYLYDDYYGDYYGLTWSPTKTQ